MLGVDEHDELIDPFKVTRGGPTYGVGQAFEQMVLENLKVAGVQQKDKADRIVSPYSRRGRAIGSAERAATARAIPNSGQVF